MKYLYIILGIIIYMCIGSIYSWSVFRKPLEEILKISATQSGMPYMLFLLFFALTMPFAGRKIEKLGPFKTILFGNIFLLTGFLISGFSQDILKISLSYGIIAGIGVGIIYGVPIAVSAKHFPERKGLAIGLTLAGFGLSPFITAPIIKNFINLYGAFNTFKILGILFFVVIFLSSLLLKFPEKQMVSNINQQNSNDTEITTGKMLKSKEFYGLWFCYLIGSISGLMAIGITSPFAQEVIGVSSSTAALFVSIFAIFNAIGRPLFGFLTDKLKYLKTILISFILILIASILGLFADKGKEVFFILSFSLFWLNLGGWLAIAPTTTSLIFGAKNYTSNYGVVFTAYGVGAVFGTILSGLFKDIFGTYKFVFYPIIFLCIMGIIISFLTLRRK